ncbi:MAG: PPC domain-containing protein, partial [Kiritimatiellaceae bacterium]|nr:PPC domain-containing protein [Kiritimatiellaceae bacterium]
MKKRLFFWFFIASAVLGDDLPHIGYIYPAGGMPGTTFKVSVGGQYLKDTLSIHLSGGRASAKVIDYKYEPDPRARNRIKNMMQKMEARLAEEPDEKVREQLRYQMQHAEGEMAMVKMAAREKRSDPEMYAKKQFNPQISDTVMLEITLDSKVEPGVHELRLITPSGLSNHLMFHVTELPELCELEPNNTIFETKGSAPELPLLLNGQIMPGDVDSFRFSAKRGRDLVFRVQARSLVPYLADAVPGWFQAVLTLYDAKGNEIAYIDDFRFDPDPVLICQVPEDGEYILEIRDSIYRGRRDFVYRIEMGELPFIDHVFPLGGEENKGVPIQLYGVNLPQKEMIIDTHGNAPEIRDVSVQQGLRRSNTRLFAVDTIPSVAELEPNNLPSEAQLLIGDVVVDGRIARPGDVDCFQFKGHKMDVVEIEVFARRLDSPLDARLILLDSEENILAISDDEVDRGSGLVTHHADSLLRYELPTTGLYTVRLDELLGKGGEEYAYRLRVGEEQPDYSLRIVPSSLTIPENGNATVTVYALRKAGFDGEIKLSIAHGPNGIELSRATIPKGQNKVHITLS